MWRLCSRDGVRACVLAGIISLMIATAPIHAEEKQNDAAGGLEMEFVTSHIGPIQALALSADGTRLFSYTYWDGPDNHTVFVWDFLTGRKLHAIKHDAVPDADQKRAGYQHLSNLLAYFSPNRSSLLTSVYRDEAISIQRDIRTGRQIREIAGYPLAASPDGQRLVTCSAPSENPNGAAAPEVGAAPGGVNQLPDPKEVKTDDSNVIFVWESGSGKLLTKLTGHRDAINSVVFGRDGKVIFSGSSDGTCRLWDSSTGNLRRTFRIPQRVAIACLISPRGDWVAACTRTDQSAFLPPGQKPHRYRPNGFGGFSPFGQGIGYGNGTGRFDFGGQFGIGGVRGFGGVGGFSGGGEAEASQNDPVDLRIWDVATGREIRSIALSQLDATAFEVSPTGKSIAVGGQGQIVLWSVESGKQERQFKFVPEGSVNAHVEAHKDVKAIRNGLRRLPVVTTLTWSADGRTLISGSDSGNISAWDVSTGKLIRRFGARINQAISAAFSPVDPILMTVHRQRVLLWDMRTGKPLRQFWQGVYDFTPQARFSPDGRRMVVMRSEFAAGDIKTSVIIDVQTGKTIHRFESHGGAQFSADGKRLFSDGDVFDLETGKLLRSFRVQQPITWQPFWQNPSPLVLPDGAFSHDGRRILITNFEGGRLFDIDSGGELVTFQSLNEGESWLAIAKDGTFDGSVDADQWLDWRRDGALVSEEERSKLLKEHRKPEVIQKLLR